MNRGGTSDTTAVGLPNYNETPKPSRVLSPTQGGWLHDTGVVWVETSGDEVGIGTSSPGSRLEITSEAGLDGLRIGTSSAYEIKFTGTTSATNIYAPSTDIYLLAGAGKKLHFGSGGINSQVVLHYNGNVGINNTNPTNRLDVKAANATAIHARSGSANDYTAYSIGRTLIDGEWGVAAGNGQYSNFATAGDIILRAAMYAQDLILTARNSTGCIRFGTGSSDTEKMTILSNGKVGIGKTDPQKELDVDGTTRTEVIEITGGSDLAEPFEIRGQEYIKPGMAVSIDPDHPGQLRVARNAYDPKVAGIISGAGGIQPGIMLAQSEFKGESNYPVALTGRVYAWADASKCPIQPGDLLTTSETPGHVMKVTDNNLAQGAIIGKAMDSLEEGRGLVLVLVALQ
ncbi:MAG: hypothetical protein JSW54_02925 [Fidelibacterota bacterium]|nr:MAG: hypothetical protein JSW54_02925 [Candidatus Neomarinimicrobiota bacterium]